MTTRTHPPDEFDDNGMPVTPQYRWLVDLDHKERGHYAAVREVKRRYGGWVRDFYMGGFVSPEAAEKCIGYGRGMPYEVKE